MRDVDWLLAHAEPTGPLETVYDRPWARVTRVPTASGPVWFKECSPVQRFEPRLVAQLFDRWPDRVVEVLAHDDEHAWLLTADAGEPVAGIGNPPEHWLALLPLYAELQRGESVHAETHVRDGVPDLRLATLPERYAELVRQPLPLDDAELGLMRGFADRFAELCGQLADAGVPETIQHDDLHMANLFHRDGRLRILDWGDSSIAHPFISLVVTFRFLEEFNGLPVDDPWFPRLRDAYLEPWGTGLRDLFALAMRVGRVAHAIASLRQRNALSAEDVVAFDEDFTVVLRRACDVI